MSEQDRIAELEQTVELLSRQLEDANRTITLMDERQHRMMVQMCCHKCGLQHPKDWPSCKGPESWTRRQVADEALVRITRR